MSFSHHIKNEICKNGSFRQRCRKAQAYGLLLFGKTFNCDSISIHTEHRQVARLYADSITDLIGLSGSITMREIRRRDRHSMYCVTVDSPEDRLAVLSCFGYNDEENETRLYMALESEENIQLFLSGAFLACAAITDPEKGYRAEFVIREERLCEYLNALLSENLTQPKKTLRRNCFVLYYKESGHIEDLLTFVGAQKSALDLMEVKIIKGVRNKVNRATNCETANITKTVNAAMDQVEAIRRIEMTIGLEQLNDDLQELAMLRLENPELSLRELGELCARPITRSGVNHRLAKLVKISQRMAEPREGEKCD